MIKLPKMIQFFRTQITNSEGLIKSIFLTNYDNEIIASVGIGNDEVTILSTLLNDSLYIINLSLYDGQQPHKTQQPLQINVIIGDTAIFLYSIKSLLIVGIIVDQKNKSITHKLAHDIVSFMEDQLDNVVQWTENNQVY